MISRSRCQWINLNSSSNNSINNNSPFINSKLTTTTGNHRSNHNNTRISSNGNNSSSNTSNTNSNKPCTHLRVIIPCNRSILTTQCTTTRTLITRTPHYGGYPQHHMYNGGISPGGNAVGGPQNATPSPTTNSDDSGGDCVTEPKRTLMVAHTVHPEPAPPPHHLHPAHHYYGRGVPLVTKRPRQPRRSKKKRDPNEPQKPVSAYALFFRDMQAGIKARNPNASFGEVSKHVASMWDNLNPDHKAAYKKRTENAKKEYLKQLAAYRANLVSKSHHGAGDPYSPYAGLASYYKSYESPYARALSGGISPAASSGAVSNPLGSPVGGDPHHPHQHPLQHQHNMGMESRLTAGGGGPYAPHGMSSPASGTTASPATSGGGAVGANGDQHQPQHHHQQQQQQQLHPSACRRPNCGNQAAPGDFGLNGYCSSECVLGQSRDVYHNWSAASTSSTTATSASSSSAVSAVAGAEVKSSALCR